MTTSSSSTMTDLADDFGAGWNRFWFIPADPLPACILRICVGLLAAAHFGDLTLSLNQWYASDGVLSPAAVRQLLTLTGGSAEQFHVSYLNAVPASTLLTVLHGLAIGVSLAFAAGLFTRVSGLLTLACVLAYVHRVPQVAGHVEPVLSFLLAYLCIAPSGAWLSLDRRLFGEAQQRPLWRLLSGSRKPSAAANIGLRLIQVHLAMFYAMMGLTKLYGDAWWQGVGPWLLIAQTESRPLDLTAIRRLGGMGEYGINFVAHLIVYFELALPVLIWTRIGRPILLALSFVVWLVLILLTGQVIFGLTMLAAGIAFTRPEFWRGCLGIAAVREPIAFG